MCIPETFDTVFDAAVEHACEAPTLKQARGAARDGVAQRARRGRRRGATYPNIL